MYSKQGLDKMSDNPEDKKKKKTNAEKPISLFGASFKDVVGALLKTPKPKEEKKNTND